MNKFVIGFLVLTLAIASAAETYRVTIFQPSMVAGKQLKPGDYKITVEGDKAILSQGRVAVEAPAKLETVEKKFNNTSVHYTNVDGKMQVQEIRIGNSNKKIVFSHQDQPGV
ncbi:MAG: hypothetical protein NZV14_18085 [Bryobacteraceae bacterium]|nr:hypothetical protein [Bryobacteraceae bacterium]MDW8380075.1 hypothetical protein [Bryobacterales bacterium]